MLAKGKSFRPTELRTFVTLSVVCRLKCVGGHVIPVASVATGFPTGQTSLKIRLEEIQFAVANGAKEVDIVINRELALAQKWQGTLIVSLHQREAYDADECSFNRGI